MYNNCRQTSSNPASCILRFITLNNNNNSTTPTTWKQVMYYGYYTNYDTLYNFITTASNNGVTHILLEFITFNIASGLQYTDTILNWTNDFSSDQRTNILNLCSSKNIKLGLSFGGATSFDGNFSELWTNSRSKYYINGTSIPNIQSSANALGSDLVGILNTNSLNYIDLDIESIPTSSQYTYGNYTDISDYLGYLSQYIKTYKSGVVISHAPQTPYFYNLSSGNWKTLYYNVEYSYGSYIDFYNVQYYNNGDYTTQAEIFTSDPYNNASVNQMIVGTTITLRDNTTKYATVPYQKIVMGKAVDAAWPGTSSSNWTSLTNYVNNQKNNTSYPNLVNWYLNGGIMVWLYRSDITPNPNTNSYTLTYNNDVKNNH